MKLHYSTSLSLLIVLGCFWSCTNSDEIHLTKTDEYEDWIKIEIPEGREAYAIAGDIDKTLLVTTWTKAFYSTDRGTTWKESFDFHGPVRDLLVRNDTVFALISDGIDSQGKPYASTSYRFTTDYGKTWKYDEKGKYSRLKSPIGETQSSAGISYRVKENKTPISQGSTIYYTNPSGIEKFNNEWMKLDLPFAVMVYNVYMDRSDRLYLTCSSGTFNTDNSLMSPPMGLPAIIFISKKPTP